ncbi:MAG: site-specific integrase, partial [Gammaproteobacteria bacterium]|nr:site-specific integrase [Gammaproteobacteria bacterium]
QCRHTYVSMLLQAGEDIRWVSSQAGHASWSFTLKTYSRYIEGNDQNRGAKIDADWNEKLTRKLTKR